MFRTPCILILFGSIQNVIERERVKCEACGTCGTCGSIGQPSFKTERVTKLNKSRQVINSAVALRRLASRSVTFCIFIINIFRTLLIANLHQPNLCSSGFITSMLKGLAPNTQRFSCLKLVGTFLWILSVVPE